NVAERGMCQARVQLLFRWIATGLSLGKSESFAGVTVCAGSAGRVGLIGKCSGEYDERADAVRIALQCFVSAAGEACLGLQLSPRVDSPLQHPPLISGVGKCGIKALDIAHALLLIRLRGQSVQGRGFEELIRLPIRSLIRLDLVGKLLVGHSLRFRLFREAIKSRASTRRE